MSEHLPIVMIDRARLSWLHRRLLLTHLNQVLPASIASCIPSSPKSADVACVDLQAVLPADK